MTFSYSPQSRALQDRHDTRRLADRLAEVKVHDVLTDTDREFIEERDMLFLATVNAEGHPTCSYKGGFPGFVAVLDRSTLAFPNYDGNGMYLSTGNISQTGGVGLLFIDFDRPRRIRVEGTAEVDPDHHLLVRYPGAQFLVVVHVDAVYPNCPRYIHRLDLKERSAFTPTGLEPPPIPDWKRADWAIDVLPKDDPARDSGA
jgi:predicted pyridoxine 5'-phosphate oxidase superfamily flavin-nucleotide-binding protein